MEPTHVHKEIQKLTSENEKLKQQLEIFKKRGMVFRLADGTELIISETDVKELSTKLITEAVTEGKVRLVTERDTNAQKARELHEVLTKEKGMSQELRVQYYEEILRLYKTSGEKIEEEFPSPVYKNRHP